MGDLLGRRKEAHDWISGYEAKAERARQLFGGLIGGRGRATASAFIFHSRRLYVYAGHHFGHTLYHAVGFGIPAKVEELIKQNPATKWKPIAVRDLPEYAGDYVFLALAATVPMRWKGARCCSSPHGRICRPFVPDAAMWWIRNGATITRLRWSTISMK